MDKKKRILTGIRPTGSLHLGHYVGALHNWIALQEEYQCNFLIADYQALSDHFQDTELIKKSVIDVTLDWLSVGLDPNKSNFVIQSYVPEHAELSMLLSFVTPLGMLERNPTLKGELDSLPIERRSAGFFSYPISQVADILLPRAHLVPVGEDQAPHLEMSREIARKFNRMYGEIFPEPETLIGKVGRLSGTDGKGKMSKSQGNVILLSDSEKSVEKKVRSMYTDPNRIRADIPGKIEGNPVFQYLDAFTNNDPNVRDFKERYSTGNIGDVEIKNYLSKTLNDFLAPIREKRSYYEQNLPLVEEALDKGINNARKMANETMGLVRDKMKISSYKKVW